MKRCASCAHWRPNAGCAALASPGCEIERGGERDSVILSLMCGERRRERGCLLVWVDAKWRSVLGGLAAEGWPVDAAGDEHPAPLWQFFFAGFGHVYEICGGPVVRRAQRNRASVVVLVLLSCSQGEGVTCVGGRVASRSECPVCRGEAAKERQRAVVRCRENEDGGSVAREGQRQEERMASARMSVWARRARRGTSRKSPASSRDFRDSLGRLRTVALRRLPRRCRVGRESPTAARRPDAQTLAR